MQAKVVVQDTKTFNLETVFDLMFDRELSAATFSDSFVFNGRTLIRGPKTRKLNGQAKKKVYINHPFAGEIIRAYALLYPTASIWNDVSTLSKRNKILAHMEDD